MAFRYEWCGDKQYYATVIDRYYAQLPFLLRLRSQAIVAWIVLTGPLLVITDLGLHAKAIWLTAVTLFAIMLTPIVRWGIILKYRLRPSFGSEVSFLMDEKGLLLTGHWPGRFQWNVYESCVRFSDGILLTRRGALRWLPDAALKEGTPCGVLELVRTKLPIRDLS